MGRFEDEFYEQYERQHKCRVIGARSSARKGAEPINKPEWLSENLTVIANKHYRCMADGNCCGGDILPREQILFYSGVRHPSSLLSNFAPTAIWWDGMAFPTGEHAFQWAKFHKVDPTGCERVLTARTPDEAKRAGRQGNMNPNWDKEVLVGGVKRPFKCHVMRRILLRKAQQNQNIHDYLLSTGDAELVEFAPWGDTFWGVDKNHYGKNWLGRLWMEVRAQLREENK